MTTMNARPLPRSFDAVVVFIVAQAHLVALLTIMAAAGRYSSRPATLVLLGCSLAVPLGCVATARLRGGGDLPLAGFAAAGAGLLIVDVASAATVRPAEIGTPAYWSPVAIGVTLLALCPYRPPRDLIVLAAAHAAVVAVVLTAHRHQPSVEPFAVIVALSAALVPAVVAAEFVRYHVRSVARRQAAIAEQSRARSRAAATAAIQQDSERRVARLRTEVLPLLADVATGRRPVDDPEGAALAQRLSADLRRELVEARSGVWLLSAPAAALAGPSLDGADGWPGIVLLDPQRLVGLLRSRDRAALSAVLAAVRSAGGWSGVSVALSTAYPESGRPDRHAGTRAATREVDDEAGAAFVTIVALAQRPLGAVDPAVAATADRAGCAVSIEPPVACVIEGMLPLQRSARLES